MQLIHLSCIATFILMSSTVFRIRPAIVLFGDSITQEAFGVDGRVGWAGLLAAAYTRRADVLNRGFSGYNTAHAIGLLPRVFTGNLPEETLFCTLFLGANDAAFPGEPQHVPIDRYETNLGTLITGIRQRLGSQTRIVLLTPPPVFEPDWAAFRNLDKSNRENDNTREYGLRAIKVAQKYNCPVVDTWSLLEGRSEERQQYLSDGLHLSEKGNRQVFAGLMEVIRSSFPDLLPRNEGDDTGIPVEEKLWQDLVNLSGNNGTSTKSQTAT